MERFIPETKLVAVDFDPFAGPAIESTIPTTEAQREVFTASLMGREASCAYNESVTLELTGVLDEAALINALDALVARHEGLRSVVSGDGMRMIVFTARPPLVQRTDLSPEAPAVQARTLDRIAEVDMTTPFDLVNGPLFRAHLIRIAPDRHLLRLTGHHVVCDGWSLGIIMSDISRLYSGEAPPPAIPMSAYALATIDLARDPEHERIERFWLERFRGAVPRLNLPVDRKRPVPKTYNGSRLDRELDQRLVRDLKEVATRNGATFVTTLLTAFELLLYKLTDQRDLVVGLPAAGQSDLDMKQLVSHCVNLLALRSTIDEERAFSDHLRTRRSEVLDAFDHQRYTFGTLLRTLHVPREPGRIPLCPVVFNVDMNMDDGVRFKGLTHRFISNARRYENFELFLNATGNEQRLVLEWSYNTDLFDRSTVNGWMDELARLIQRIAINPAASIGDLVGDGPLTAERQLPPEGWLGASPDYPRDKSIGRLWDEVVIRFGDRTAVEFVEERVTYTQLDRRVHAIATALLAAGVKSGDPVTLCTERSVDMLAAMLAILRCGATFVPLDPAYPADRLAFMFEDTASPLLLTQRALAPTLPTTAARRILLEDIPATDARVPDRGAPTQAAYIMYTSGSTGRPKGVVVPQRAIVRLVRAQNFLPFGPELTFLQLSNISFDASTLEIWGALLNGGRLVLQPQQKPTLLEILETIREKRVTTVWFTAGLFNVLVDEHVERLRGLKHILTGGDVLSVPHVERALQVLGPGVLINGYGPTENTTFTCCHAIDDADGIKGSVPIGRPIHHTRVHVLDEQLRPVPVGQKGELYASGDGLAIGYWKRPELTAERFVEDPQHPGRRLYRTGDIVRWLHNGTIEFIGRNDDQVKVRGFRVELGEIENALNGLPGVKDRVVMARDEMAGEKQLVAYVVPQDAAMAEEAASATLVSALREHLRAHLPEHMVPTAFVVMPAFPLNPNGKVDKKALPPPPAARPVMRARHVAARSATETALCAIWNEALGLSDVGVHDNFFDIGGHSLSGIQLLSKVEERFGRPLEYKQLFLAPTVAQMAKLLDPAGKLPRLEHLLPIQPAGTRTPIFCVHGDEANVFLPKYLGDDQPFYAISHQGEDGSPIVQRSVEAMAAAYLTEIRQVQPTGPYLLMGYSFGGILAYELAQQLRNAGQEVGALMLLDTYDPVDYAEVAGREQRFYQSVKDAVVRIASQAFHRRGMRLPVKLRHNYIIGTYDRLIRNYRTQPYPGRITLLRTKDTHGRPDMGWGAHAPGGLDIRMVPGDHFNVVKEPHVRTVADEVRSVVAERLRTPMGLVRS